MMIMMKVLTMMMMITPWSRVPPEKLTDKPIVKKILHVLWNAKFHYHTHKSTLPVPILSNIITVHAFNALLEDSF